MNGDIESAALVVAVGLIVCTFLFSVILGSFHYYAFKRLAEALAARDRPLSFTVEDYEALQRAAR